MLAISAYHGTMGIAVVRCLWYQTLCPKLVAQLAGLRRRSPLWRADPHPDVMPQGRSRVISAAAGQ